MKKKKKKNQFQIGGITKIMMSILVILIIAFSAKLIILLLNPPEEFDIYKEECKNSTEIIEISSVHNNLTNPIYNCFYKGYRTARLETKNTTRFYEMIYSGQCWSGTILNESLNFANSNKSDWIYEEIEIGDYEECKFSEVKEIKLLNSCFTFHYTQGFGGSGDRPETETKSLENGMLETCFVERKSEIDLTTEWLDENCDIYWCDLENNCGYFESIENHGWNKWKCGDYTIKLK